MINFADSVNLIGSAFPIGTGTYAFFVNALDETGAGKILAEPTLVARTGETARFLSGGEVPIPIAQGGIGVGSIRSSTRSSASGSRSRRPCSVTTASTSTSRTEVSQVDFGLGTVRGRVRSRRASARGAPPRASSSATARRSRSRACLRDELTENVSMYPLLGQIPILGALFRNSTYQKQTTELVLLVRPRLVKPLGPEAPPPLPTDYFDEPNWFEFYLLGRTEGFDNRVAARRAGGRLRGRRGLSSSGQPRGSC